jgi:uncharacterized protein YecE (DUF72 family)
MASTTQTTDESGVVDPPRFLIGCAGWSLRKDVAEHFSTEGSHLQRYSARIGCAEINSSFYRPHRKSTYERWAASTPSTFRFAVKMPKSITHIDRLCAVDTQIEQFASETSGLAEKLGAILVQLPPSLQFSATTATRFFHELRSRFQVPIVCEPRHATWFETEPEALMREFAVARVAADPACVPMAAISGGHPQTRYFRWHGSPRMYYSAYDEQALRELAGQLLATAVGTHAWCIFDNTAEGAALKNAIRLAEIVQELTPGTFACR